MAGFENDIMFAKNADFTQADNQAPVEANGLATNGQLWIGATTANAGGTHINVGTFTSPDSSITFGYSSPNITAVVNTAVMTDLHDSRFIVSNTDLTHGANYSTIAAAIAAAVLLGGVQTVFIQPGTYVEDLIFEAGINLCAHSCDANTPNVIIDGTGTAFFSGSCSLSGITFQNSNTGAAVNVTGADATILNLINCFFKIVTSPGTCISNSSASADSAINIISCSGDISVAGMGGTGVALFSNTSAGSMNFYSSHFTNSIGAIVANSCGTTFSGEYASLNVFSSSFENGIGGQTRSNIIISNCSIKTPNANCLSIANQEASTFVCSNSYLDSGTESAVFFNSGVASILNSTIKSSNTNAIVTNSSGTISYGNLSFSGTSSQIDPTLTQIPLIRTNDAVKIITPSGYPYTTEAQDAVVLVDTASARTIVPLASPTTGQMHRIKDSVGSAATNNITITPSGKNIDGAASFIIATNYQSVDIVYNGTEWNLI